MSAQGSDTKQNGLVVKLSATWCPVCSGAAWNSYNWLLNNVKNIKNIKNIPEIGTNVYDILKYHNVLFTHSSIKKLQERLLK